MGATFPKEYLKHMNVESGDEVFITKEPGGRIVLSPNDPNFAAALEARERVRNR